MVQFNLICGSKAARTGFFRTDVGQNGERQIPAALAVV